MRLPVAKYKPFMDEIITNCFHSHSVNERALIHRICKRSLNNEWAMLSHCIRIKPLSHQYVGNCTGVTTRQLRKTRDHVLITVAHGGRAK